MDEKAHTKKCNQCSADFLCGSSSDGGPCWCASWPTILPVREATNCLCPTCFKIYIKEKITAYMDGINAAQAVELDFTKYQTNELAEGIDFYVESGNYVFTKWYHLKRGHCCNSGCRHCPYG